MTRLAPPPPRASSTITPLLAWYRDARRRLETNLGRPPSTGELAAYCRRNKTTAHRALIRLARLGALRRDRHGRYVERRNATRTRLVR